MVNVFQLYGPKPAPSSSLFGQITQSALAEGAIAANVAAHKAIISNEAATMALVVFLCTAM